MINGVRMTLVEALLLAHAIEIDRMYERWLEDFAKQPPLRKIAR